MTRSTRWAVVVALAAALALTPVLVRVLPVPGARAEGSAAALLQRMRASWGRPYAGYVESTGSIALPVSDQFESVASLLGGRTQLRVWWRAPDDWRADTLSPTGEHSIRTSRDGVWVWDFEGNRVTRLGPVPQGEVRLPQDADSLPPALAARMLVDARPEEVSTLPSRRVAGRATDGLRLRPSEPLSSIGRVDVWADRSSGIPVLVEVYGTSPGVAALSTTFLDFTPTKPAAADTAFAPPPGSRLRTGSRFDVLAAVRQFSVATPPDALLGMRRGGSATGVDAIGQYGRGVTQALVAALPPRLARSLRSQLQGAAGVSRLPEGLMVVVGPVGLLLTDPGRTGEDWLVTGTLTPQGLARAATELAASPGAGG
ncbi:LolA family protein [Pedococcus sp. 5OH_020]|uniref:LolA family protein n=1 Tax=Pedococcus sp. 5OH_020 TaxID=2989814 RepID=UPI0022E99ED0|nr:hypothetical protein [Pedococcus sp. 5OH_020]